MVITTHMYNQIIQEKQNKINNDEVLSNPDSALIKLFLKDSIDFATNEKRVISSNS